MLEPCPATNLNDVAGFDNHLKTNDLKTHNLKVDLNSGLIVINPQTQHSAICNM